MPPNSALTRFIKQGLRRGVCPLCRVAYKIDGEYTWAFFDDYSSDDKTLDRLRQARGFCADARVATSNKPKASRRKRR